MHLFYCQQAITIWHALAKKPKMTFTVFHFKDDLNKQTLWAVSEQSNNHPGRIFIKPAVRYLSIGN